MRGCRRTLPAPAVRPRRTLCAERRVGISVGIDAQQLGAGAISGAGAIDGPGEDEPAGWLPGGVEERSVDDGRRDGQASGAEGLVQFPRRGVACDGDASSHLSGDDDRPVGFDQDAPPVCVCQSRESVLAEAATVAPRERSSTIDRRPPSRAWRTPESLVPIAMTPRFARDCRLAVRTLHGPSTTTAALDVRGGARGSPSSSARSQA